MSRHNIDIGRLQIAVFALTAGAALATDVGLPLHSNATGDRGNFEFYYEQYRRDIVQDYLDGRRGGEQREWRIIERVNVHAGSHAALYGEIGGTRSEGSEHLAPLFGAGLVVRACDTRGLQVNAFASGTYVPGILYRQSGGVSYDEPGYDWVDYPDLVQRETYYEANVGLSASRFFPVTSGTTCAPYGGFMLSRLDGREEYEQTYHVLGRTETTRGDLKGDGVLSLFAGLGLTLNKAWCLRFEGRFVNQTSFSAGLVCFF